MLHPRFDRSSPRCLHETINFRCVTFCLRECVCVNVCACVCAPDCCPLAGRSCCCACVVVLFLLFCAFQLKMRTAFWTTAIGLGLVLICSWHACSMAAPAASPPSSPAVSTPHSFLAAAVPSTSPVASTFPTASSLPFFHCFFFTLHLHLLLHHLLLLLLLLLPLLSLIYIKIS